MIDAKKLLEGTTPGPWAQYDQDPVIIVNCEGGSLGEMTSGYPTIGEKEDIANARLAAAAPDLAARVIELEAENAELRKQADALARALVNAMGELHVPEPNCSCHISPPCRDCLDYASIREVNALGFFALAAYRSAKP